jgi:hypothetical protein
MAEICTTSSLPNIGKDCKFKIQRPRRLMLTSAVKEDGTANKISLTNAALLSAWQALFDKPDFSTSILEKVVPSPLIYEATTSIENENRVDSDTYSRTIYKGDTDINFMYNDSLPEVIKQMQAMESRNIAAYIVDDDGVVIGKKVGTDLYPLALSELETANYQLPADGVSQTPGRIRFTEGSDLNSLTAVTVLDASGNVVNMAESVGIDVYSLTDVTLTSADPAVTGCTFTATIDRSGSSLDTIAFGDITFVNQSSGATETLAGAGSLSYNATTKVYTVNEAALLTTANTYKIQIVKSKFNVVHSNTVIVP